MQDVPGGKKRKGVRAEPKIRWWKLKEKECCVNFREMTIQALGGNKEYFKNGRILQRC